jgi:arylamine N-acetyltransferase
MDPALVDDVVRRLGFEGRPQPTFAGLSALYLAWCRNIPFDNLRKRRWLADGAEATPPGAEANDFFTAFLEHGTGGTCWSTSNGLTELLLALGFDARRVASSMLPFPGITHRPNHGTTVVRFGEEQWLVDTSMLTEVPLPLLPGEESSAGEGILATRVAPAGSLWRVWWKPWPRPGEMPCELEVDPADADLFLGRYWASAEASPFNASLYARKGAAEGARAMVGSTLFEIDRSGTTTETDVSGSRDEVLRSTFGFSAEVVAAIPPDQPGPGPRVPSP